MLYDLVSQDVTLMQKPGGTYNLYEHRESSAKVRGTYKLCEHRQTSAKDGECTTSVSLLQPCEP
jgi:hypothetical protein